MLDFWRFSLWVVGSFPVCGQAPQALGCLTFLLPTLPPPSSSQALSVLVACPALGSLALGAHCALNLCLLCTLAAPCTDTPLAASGAGPSMGTPTLLLFLEGP